MTLRTIALCGLVSLNTAGLFTAYIWAATSSFQTPTQAYLLRPTTIAWVDLINLVALAASTLLFFPAALSWVAGRSRWVTNSGLAVLIAAAALGMYSAGASIIVSLWRSSPFAVPLTMLASIVSVWVCFRRRDQDRLPRIALICTVALAPLMATRAAWSIAGAWVGFSRSPSGAVHAAVGSQQSQAGTILFIVFDEMDAPLLWQSLPKLPNLRSLAESSVIAKNAHSPADWTMLSIPSYTTGEVVTGSSPVKERKDLQLTTTTRKQPVSWIDHPGNLFRLAQNGGFRPAIAGFFHPYCDLFESFVSSCHAEEGDGMGEYPEWAVGMAGRPFMSSLKATMLVPLQFWTRPRFDGRHFPLHQWKSHEMKADNRVARTQRLVENAVQTIRSGASSFVYVHLPVPHMPAPIGMTYEDSYLEADRILGRILDTLKEKKRFEDSTILVTSDHSLREFWHTLPSLDPVSERVLSARNPRAVPLLLKLPGIHQPVTYQERCSAVAAYDICTNAMAGRLNQNSDVLAILRANSSERDPAK